MWLRTMYNKPMAEISLTIAGAYATYIVADQLFGVSAVLAIVSLGTASHILCIWHMTDNKCLAFFSWKLNANVSFEIHVAVR